ncbi:MAG: right-handed parallel beta-helix repeat-containing protein [Paludibacter sp.]|nr:right-handed parallel beta-helix repeat-containing protein [Paludibacter sp.]
MKKIKKQIICILSLIVIFHGISFAQGSTYSGPYTDSAPIILDGVSNQTISKLKITNGSGHCIKLSNCSNITIQYCKLGPSKGEGVFLSNCKNITVTNCSMDAVESGVVADIGTGIKVTNNDVKNVQGPMPRGQMVQFGNVSGAGNSISYNVVENIQGQSYPEDEISLFMSNGTASDPIQVVGNWIRGGGPSTSGGGIMTGDEGGSNVLVQDNILVNPGQYGITISSGTNITIKNNKIYSEKLPFSNIGLSAYRQYNITTSGNTIMNNEVNFTNKDGVLNNMWNAGNCGTITGWDTNIYNPNLNASILPSIIIGRAQADTIATPKQDTIAKPKQVDHSLKIFPNPVYSRSIKVTATAPINQKIIIYDLKGQIQIQQSINSSEMEIDTGNLTAGVYIIKIYTNDTATDVRKIIVGKK